MKVVHFMVQQIKKLPVETQQILALAACIGNKFSIQILSIVNQQSILATSQKLWCALTEGFVLPLDHRYKIAFVSNPQDDSKIHDIRFKFSHDRVQQAAYSLIPESQKKKNHGEIGKLLLRNIPSTKLDEHFFEIITHLNYDADSLPKGYPNEHEQELTVHDKDGFNQDNYKNIQSLALKPMLTQMNLALLNSLASSKAKQAGFFETAVKYADTGISILGTEIWMNFIYKLSFQLYVEAISSLYYASNIDKAQRYISIALEKVITPIEKGQIHLWEIKCLISEGKTIEAVMAGLKCCQILDSEIPITLDGQIALMKQVDEIVLSGRDLHYLPIMTDPVKTLACNILTALISPVKPFFFFIFFFSQAKSPFFSVNRNDMTKDTEY